MGKNKKIEIVLVGILVIMVVVIGCYLYQEKELQGEGAPTSIGIDDMYGTMY
mgnify:CR=1 FL=1